MRSEHLHVTNVSNWKLWCGGSPSADLLDRPGSVAHGLGITNLRDAVRACAVEMFAAEAAAAPPPHAAVPVRGSDARAGARLKYTTVERYARA